MYVATQHIFGGICPSFHLVRALRVGIPDFVVVLDREMKIGEAMALKLDAMGAFCRT